MFVLQFLNFFAELHSERRNLLTGFTQHGLEQREPLYYLGGTDVELLVFLKLRDNDDVQQVGGRTFPVEDGLEILLPHPTPPLRGLGGEWIIVHQQAEE